MTTTCRCPAEPGHHGCLSGGAGAGPPARVRGRKHLVVADVCPPGRLRRLCCYDDEDAWRPLGSACAEAVSWGWRHLQPLQLPLPGVGLPGRGAPASKRLLLQPADGHLEQRCALNQARPHCRLVALDGQLHAVGRVSEHGGTLRPPPGPLDSARRRCPRTPSPWRTRRRRAGASSSSPGARCATCCCASPRPGTALARRAHRGGRDRTAEMAGRGFLYRFDRTAAWASAYRCSASARLWYECATYRTPHPRRLPVRRGGRARLLRGAPAHAALPGRLHLAQVCARNAAGLPLPQGTLLPTVLTSPVLMCPRPGSSSPSAGLLLQD